MTLEQALQVVVDAGLEVTRGNGGKPTRRQRVTLYRDEYGGYRVEGRKSTVGTLNRLSLNFLTASQAADRFLKEVGHESR